MARLWGGRRVWVCGREDLARRVLAGLRTDGYRAARLKDPQAVARLRPGRVRVLILADPPAAEDLLRRLARRLLGRVDGPAPADPSAEAGAARRPAPSPAGPGAQRSRRGPALRLLVLHPAGEPPRLPPALAELAPDGPLALEVLALEDRAARVLLARWPPHFGMDPGFGQRPHVLFAGSAAPARALLVQTLRLVHYDEAPARVTVVCSHADPGAAAFARAYPQAGQAAELRWTDGSLPGLAAEPPVTQVWVCAETPEAGLALARALARRIAHAQGVAPPVLLEVGEGAPAGRLEDWDGQLFPFSYLDEACRGRVLLDGAGDGLARTIHDHYRDSIAAQGRDLAGEPAGRAWERLPESYRDANRHQADHLEAKLAATDCRAVPEDRVDAFAFAPLETERLAAIEHLRWAADRWLDGWTYAPERDNADKRHPQLVPYADLSEPMKDLDRFAVRGVPALLARSGLGVVRMLILGVPAAGPPGRSVADAGLPEGVLGRLADRLLARLLARYPDRALAVASTLADGASRLVVRRALERAGAALFLLCPGPIETLLDAQPEAAARRDLLALVARAERRIALPGAGETERWLAGRAEILLAWQAQPEPAGAGPGRPKRVVLDAARRRLAWGFEY